MKKLLAVLIVLVTFVQSCTPNSIEEENNEKIKGIDRNFTRPRPPSAR
jgi:outer membrane lipoprotein-sorting protein